MERLKRLGDAGKENCRETTTTDDAPGRAGVAAGEQAQRASAAEGATRSDPARDRAARSEARRQAQSQGQTASQVSISEEIEVVLAPYQLSPETFSEQRHSGFYNQLREHFGAEYRPELRKLSKWFVILKLDDDEPNQQAMTEKLSLLQILMQEAFALPRNVALQTVLLHVAIMSRLYMYIGTDRRMAVVESWNFSVSVLGGESGHFHVILKTHASLHGRLEISVLKPKDPDAAGSERCRLSKRSSTR